MFIRYRGRKTDETSETRSLEDEIHHPEWCNDFDDFDIFTDDEEELNQFCFTNTNTDQNLFTFYFYKYKYSQYRYS